MPAANAYNERLTGWLFYLAHGPEVMAVIFAKILDPTHVRIEAFLRLVGVAVDNVISWLRRYDP